MSRVRLITVAGDPEREARLATDVGSRNEVELVLRCLDRVEVLAAIRGSSLDAIIVIGDPPWFDAQCADEAHRSRVRLVALCSDEPSRRRFDLLGASTLDVDSTVDEVLANLMTPTIETDKVPVHRPTPSGKLLCVWGPKGAPGRSCVARELAAELAYGEPRTLLVDADTYGGDLLQLFGITEEIPSIVWACRMAAKRELDGSSLAYELRRTGEAGPVLLPGIPRAELWPEISDFGWREFLQCARGSFSFTVCDLGFCLEPALGPYPDAGEGRNRLTRVALREADHVIAVARADPLGIKNFVWAFHQLTDLVDESRILVIANRVAPGEEHDVTSVIHRYVRKRPVALVPEEAVAFSNAESLGKPVSAQRAGGAVREAILELAAAVGAPVQRGGFLSRLAGRS